MVWKTLAESLESALASMVNEVGEGAIAVASDAAMSKKRPDRSPAKFQVNNEQRGTSHSGTQPGKAPASLGNAKGRRTHPHELAPLGVRQPLMLRVIEGGGPARAQGGVRPGRLARLPGGNSRSNWLKLVHCASSS